MIPQWLATSQPTSFTTSMMARKLLHDVLLLFVRDPSVVLFAKCCVRSLPGLSYSIKLMNCKATWSSIMQCKLDLYVHKLLIKTTFCFKIWCNISHQGKLGKRNDKPRTYSPRHYRRRCKLSFNSDRVNQQLFRIVLTAFY